MEKKMNEAKTDWDIYYKKPYKTASYSRKITEKILIKLIKKFCKNTNQLKIVELGGAGSCFFEPIMVRIKPLHYTIIDNNPLGNKEFVKKFSSKYPSSVIEGDILYLNIQEKFDIAMSIGLIEHFSEDETKKIIEAHFNILNNGGVAIILFPTPTFLYRITRFFSELLGLWIFHDERPITMNEARSQIKKHGQIVFEKINWPIFLTQGIIVAKKNELAN